MPNTVSSKTKSPSITPVSSAKVAGRGKSGSDPDKKKLKVEKLIEDIGFLPVPRNSNGEIDPNA
jgi:hypothetical protein